MSDAYSDSTSAEDVESSTPKSSRSSSDAGSNRDVQSWKLELARLLQQTDIIDTILDGPASKLEGVNLRYLGRIAAHFGQDSSDEPEPKRRRTVTSTAARKAASASASTIATMGSWSPVLGSSLVPHPAVKEYLGKSALMMAEEPDKDMTNTLLGIHFFQNQQLTNSNWKYSSTQTGDAFKLQFQYMNTLLDQQGLDRARWLFQVVFWHDLYMLVRPDTTGNKLSHSMTEAVLETLLTNVPGQTEVVFGRTKHEMTTQIKDWAMKGLKAKILVDRFGVGSLFLLQDILTPNFLKDKMTGKGRQFDAAMNYLEKQGDFKQKLRDDPKLGEVGKVIREYLIRPFSDVHQGALQNAELSEASV